MLHRTIFLITMSAIFMLSGSTKTTGAHGMTATPTMHKNEPRVKEIKTPNRPDPYLNHQPQSMTCGDKLGTCSVLPVYMCAVLYCCARDILHGMTRGR